MARRIVFGTLSALIMAAIFILSAQSGETSAAASGGVADAVLSRSDDYISLDDGQKFDVHENVGHIIRKAAHAAEYFALSAVLCLFLLSFSGNVAALSSLAALISFAYAISDELHQTLVPGRSGELADVLIDLAGACAAAVIFGAVAAVYRRKKAEKDAARAEQLAWLAN